MSRALLALGLTTVAVLAVALRAPPARLASVPVARLGSLEACRQYSGLPPGFGQDPQAGMQWLPGGRARLGSQRGYAEERPERDAVLPGFWIDRTEVSNAQYAAFVAATSYVTEVERQGAALGFEPPASLEQAVAANSWWRLRPGADWRHPEGPGSSLAGRDNQPVVNLSYADALAYARWLGRSLPTEAQWEYAARAGRDNLQADITAYGHAAATANAWQGLFPYRDEGRDGFRGRAPVGCFAANPYGLYDTVGNVWEWTRDLWTPAAGDEHAPAVPRVIKGGSFLCSADWCVRARASSRQPQESDLAALHLGFRTVREGTR